MSDEEDGSPPSSLFARRLPPGQIVGRQLAPISLVPRASGALLLVASHFIAEYRAGLRLAGQLVRRQSRFLWRNHRESFWASTKGRWILLFLLRSDLSPISPRRYFFPHIVEMEIEYKITGTRDAVHYRALRAEFRRAAFVARLIRAGSPARAVPAVL